MEVLCEVMKLLLVGHEHIGMATEVVVKPRRSRLTRTKPKEVWQWSATRKDPAQVELPLDGIEGRLDKTLRDRKERPRTSDCSEKFDPVGMASPPGFEPGFQP